MDDVLDLYNRLEGAPIVPDELRQVSSFVQYQNMFQFIGLCNLDGIIIDVNDTAASIINLERKEIVGKYFWDTYWWDVNDNVKSTLKEKFFEAVKGDKFVRYDTIINAPRRNGGTIHIDMYFSPLRDKNGVVRFIIPEARDTNQQKIAEQEMIKARIRAEEASKAKSNFLATMTHELRTPLNGIICLLDIILDDKLDSELFKRLILIKESSNNLCQIINQILDFSTFEHNRINVNKTNFNLNKTILNVIQLLQPKAQKNGNIIITRLPDINIHTDKLLYCQVLINFIGNAIKFTENGKISVNCEYGNGILTTDVVDTGQGIDKSNLDKIFDIFYKIDNIRNSTYTGTGLGLAICNKIITLLDGQIAVTSEIGKGSTFTFKIKTELAEYDDDTDVVTNDSFSSNFSKKFPLKILAVDDNRINRIVLYELLKKMGYYNVDVVEDGFIAIDHVKNKVYDLIFMDIRMPKIGGIETTNIIRKSYPDLPIIVALTANTLEIDKELYKEVGMFDHLSKPIVIQDLKKVLIKVYNHVKLHHINK